MELCAYYSVQITWYKIIEDISIDHLNNFTIIFIMDWLLSENIDDPLDGLIYNSYLTLWCYVLPHIIDCSPGMTQ